MFSRSRDYWQTSTVNQKQEQSQMQTTRPFEVLRDGRFVFTIHARSLEQARQLVEARIGDTVAVVITAVRCRS